MSDSPTHLFISYADEDSVFAGWLARKLSTYGYAVWYDRIKILGGEPWPQTIDEAIKNRTFRMLALMSAHSVHKPNPSKERTLALKIAKQREIPDFLITLKLDNTDLDWLTTDISYIPFDHGWASGLRKLLEKLSTIEVPKTLINGPLLTASTCSQGDELVGAGEEELLVNVIKIEGIPEVLYGYKQNRDLTEVQQDQLESTWTHYTLESAEMVAFFPPPPQFAEIFEPTREQYLWAECGRVRKANARDVAASIVIKIIQKRLLQVGAALHPKYKGFIYLPEEFGDNGKLRFVGYKGKKTWIKIRGRSTFFRIGQPKEINFHHYAFRFRLARGLDKSLWLQITPSLFFFDEKGVPILDDRVGPRRRKLTKTWWNDKWINRLLAAEHIMINLPNEQHEKIKLGDGFLRLTWGATLNEGALEPLDEIEIEEAFEEVPILLDDSDDKDMGNSDE